MNSQPIHIRPPISRTRLITAPSQHPHTHFHPASTSSSLPREPLALSLVRDQADPTIRVRRGQEWRPFPMTTQRLVGHPVSISFPSNMSSSHLACSPCESRTNYILTMTLNPASLSFILSLNSLSSTLISIANPVSGSKAIGMSRFLGGRGSTSCQSRERTLRVRLEWVSK